MVRHEACPRCGGQLIDWQDSDSSCLQCGYVAHRLSSWSADLIGRNIKPESGDEPEASEEREPPTPE